MLGTRPDGVGWAGVLDGRIEDPLLLCGAVLDPAPIEPEAAGPALIAWWDLSADIPTQRVTDRGPHGWHGTTRNLPTRAVRGSRRQGAEWGAYSHNPNEHPEYDGSTYNRHPDGSGWRCPPCICRC